MSLFIPPLAARCSKMQQAFDKHTCTSTIQPLLSRQPLLHSNLPGASELKEHSGKMVLGEADDTAGESAKLCETQNFRKFKIKKLGGTAMPSRRQLYISPSLKPRLAVSDSKSPRNSVKSPPASRSSSYDRSKAHRLKSVMNSNLAGDPRC